MRPLSADDRFIEDLTSAVAHARKGLEPADARHPAAAEVAALCNTALQLCVARYEGAPLFTTLVLFDSAEVRSARGFMRLTHGPDWRALARGFPEGLATCVERGRLVPFAGLTVPLRDSTADGLPRALVLPGVVGVTIAGELLAELRPGRGPETLAVPRPSLESLLGEAGLPGNAPLRPSHLRRILQVARQHHHGASVVVTSAPMPSMPDASPLAGVPVDWPDLKDALARVAPLEADLLADALGRLTAVDGAIVLSHEGLVSGFGLRLSARADAAVSVLYSDRLGEGPTIRNEDPATGSRRRTAVDYVTAHAGCFALVLSSDGPLSLASRRDDQTVTVQRGLECLL